MDWMARIIDDFGRQIGLPGLALDENGKLRMGLEDGTGIGLLQVTADGGGEIVVYRSCPLTYLDPQAYRTALRLADFRQPNPWPVQAGISQRELLFAMRIPGRAFSSTSLDHACNRLQELTQAIRR